MTTKDEALKQALEALEGCHTSDTSMYQSFNKTKTDTAITAIKEALAQPEPVNGLDVYIDPTDGNVKKHKQAQPEQEPVALMVLEDCGWELVDGLDGDWLETIPFGTILYMHTTPPKAQPEQDNDDLTIAYMSGYQDGKTKPWVGLTDAEIDECANAKFVNYLAHINDDYQRAFARAIEAKLKEKNT